MKLAIIGSRNINEISLSKYVESGVSEIISGGACGVDKLAKDYAIAQGIKYTEFLPDYKRYGRCAPLKRNEQIAQYADAVLAIWDSKSKGTAYTVRLFKRLGKGVRVITVVDDDGVGHI